MAKISGPLLDRIDLHIDVPAVKYKELASKDESEASQKIRERVVRARELQMKRFAGRLEICGKRDILENPQKFVSSINSASSASKFIPPTCPTSFWQNGGTVIFSLKD
jgi:magnesium chelatase family protein